MQVINGSKFPEIKEELESCLFYQFGMIEYIIIREIDRVKYDHKRGDPYYSFVDFDFQELIKKVNSYYGIERASTAIARRAKNYGVQNFLLEVRPEYQDYPAILNNYRLY